jgi:hypothetical protein
MKHSAIRFWATAPDYSDMPVTQYNSEYSIYGEQEEMASVPGEAPEPKGPTVFLPIILTLTGSTTCSLDVR